jgi:hypothetical protein
MTIFILPFLVAVEVGVLVETIDGLVASFLVFGKNFNKVIWDGFVQLVMD